MTSFTTRSLHSFNNSFKSCRGVLNYLRHLWMKTTKQSQTSQQTWDSVGDKSLRGKTSPWQWFPCNMKMFLYRCSSTVVSIFSTPLNPDPNHPPFPPLIPALLGFVHVSLIVVPENPSSFYPHYPLTPLVTVSLFLISMPLVIVCLSVLLIRFCNSKKNSLSLSKVGIECWILGIKSLFYHLKIKNNIMMQLFSGHSLFYS